MKAAMRHSILLFFVLAALAGKVQAQCSGSTPVYTINLTGKPDSVWTSPSTSRNGQCCGASSSQRCIRFIVTLDANATGIRVDMSNSASSTSYTVGCGTTANVGDTVCLSGTGPHSITICRNSTTAAVYTITSIRKATIKAGNDTTICASYNAVFLNGTVPASAAGTGVWSSRGGNFIPSNTAMNARYVPSKTEIDAGFTYVVLTAKHYINGAVCTTVKDSIKVTITSPPLPIISGAFKACEFTTGNLYSVAAVPGNTYDWHVVGGSITSGQGTRQITVNWGAEGPGYIYMVQKSATGCEGVGAINTISRFDFNSTPLTKASIGPDALSADADAYSDGIGYRITDNCGGNKGIDLTIPGSVFDRGKMCMTFSWQRDESFAEFFTRGTTKFSIDNGVLIIAMRVDSAGVPTTIGPLNTGYTVPNDDITRYFTFCYDSASGVARVLVNDSIVWNYASTKGRSLYWTGSGNAVIGTIMDGSCAGNTLIDWSNISIPISLVPKPEPIAITGPTVICRPKTGIYSSSKAQNYYKNQWTVSNGTILSGQGTTQITVLWNTPGAQTVTLVQTDSINGCDSTKTLGVMVYSKPPASIIGKDSLCQTIAATYKSPTGASYKYQWSSATATFTGSTTKDSARITFAQGGIHTLKLTITDTISGCDSVITKQIVVDSIPVLSLTGSTPVCQKHAGTYQTLYRSNYQYNWIVTGGTVSSGAGTNIISVQWPNAVPGNVYVKVITTGGCQQESTMPVTIYPAPSTSPISYH